MILEIGLGIAGALLAVFAVGRLFDAWYPRLLEIQATQLQKRADLVRLQHMENQAKLRAVRHFAPDEHGQLGVAYDASTGRYTNLVTQTVFDQWRIHQFDPVRERLATIERLMLVSGERSQEAQQTATIDEPVDWTRKVVYLDEITHGPFSLHNLVLGVVPNQDTEWHVVRGDLSAMVHVLISSRSGWGKSKLLQTLAYELSMAGDCDLALVDYGINTFARLQNSRSLKYQIADSPDTAIALFHELIQEMNRRRELFREYPEAENLDDYNRLSGNGVRPVVFMCDEGTQLVVQEGIKEPMTTLLQMARKFGVWGVVAGQNWKASIMPTELRDNFSSRIALNSSPSSSRIMIDSADASDLPVPGRAIAILPGQKPVTMHVPMIRDWQNIPNGHPATLEPFDPDGDLTQRVIETWESLDKPSITAVTQALFDGQRGGSHWDDVRDIVYGQGLE